MIADDSLVILAVVRGDLAEEGFRKLDRLSRTDALTGQYNRMHLHQELARLHNDAVRHHDALCVLLLDLDHFKRIDDEHGHAIGDQALRAFADRLSAELRAGDIGGRRGGEEFPVVLPRTDLDGALAVAERIRTATASEPIVADGGTLGMTVSGGCAAGPGDSPAALVHRADTCPYRVKLEGRNRIVTT